MKASDLFVKCLEQEGIEYVFGVPGEENADFIMSLEASEQIKFVLTRHEQGAEPGPSLVTLPIDYRENGLLTQRLGEIVCPI